MIQKIKPTLPNSSNSTRNTTLQVVLGKCTSKISQISGKSSNVIGPASPFLPFFIPVSVRLLPSQSILYRLSVPTPDLLFCLILVLSLSFSTLRPPSLLRSSCFPTRISSPSLGTQSRVSFLLCFEIDQSQVQSTALPVVDFSNSSPYTPHPLLLLKTDQSFLSIHFLKEELSQLVELK